MLGVCRRRMYVVKKLGSEDLEHTAGICGLFIITPWEMAQRSLTGVIMASEDKLVALGSLSAGEALH